MFKKIVSQLSLSPSASSQLAFYAKRLGQEKVSRTFSAIAAVLIVGLQFATIAAPPAVVNAASPNDIIYGGVVSLQDLLSHYDAKTAAGEQLRDIYGHWGVTRSDIANAHLATINSLDLSLKSLGRDQHLASDTDIPIDHVDFWQRVLHTWDTGSFVQTGSNYQVFEGTASNGNWFAIMLACGNIVVKKNPTPPPPPPPPTPTPTPTPPPPPKNSIDCDWLEGSTNTGAVPLDVKFTGYGDASGETITGYKFTYGDGGSTSGSATSGQNLFSATHIYKATGDYTAYLQLNSSTGKTTPEIKACSYNVDVIPPPANFTKHKSALNLTQNIDATTAAANAGDVIRYVLATQNTGGVPADFVVTEHIDSILEYADVTDAGGAQVNGGVMVWPQAVIQPGQTLTKSFTVTVKNPIPTTPVGTSDKFSYDMRMDNVYGNAIEVQIKPPLPKEVEGASTSLPQTGASTSTMIVLAICALCVYFYLRNRQLAKEIGILRNDYQGSL